MGILTGKIRHNDLFGSLLRLRYLYLGRYDDDDDDTDQKPLILDKPEHGIKDFLW